MRRSYGKGSPGNGYRPGKTLQAVMAGNTAQKPSITAGIANGHLSLNFAYQG
jgi:hypothetical protein